jgi:rod shape-determining protein MreC
MLLLVLISISLLIGDLRGIWVHRWKSHLRVVVYPIYFFVDTPIRFYHWVENAVSLQGHLLRENAALKSRNISMQSKLQMLLVLQHENRQLSSLLGGAPKVSARVQLARILAIRINPSLKQFVINQGVTDKVYVGQPVLDGYGVMGKVVDVGVLSSRVLQVNDQLFSMPVKDYRNGLRSVASGTRESDLLHLENVTQTSDIKVGDVMVSSGFALQFPVGYPVGKVTSIQHRSGDRFLTVNLEPMAHLDQSQLVLLAWPDQAKLQKQVDAQMKQPLGGEGNASDS